MKSLAKKILLAIAVTALGVTFPGPVTAQIYTNVIGVPISQLPDIGTNNITGSDIIPYVSLQGTNLTTVKVKVLNLKTNFQSGDFKGTFTGNLINPVPWASLTNKPSVSVSDFGTIGTTNDTAVFMAAFNSGLPVKCPLGDYYVTNIVFTNDNEAISGYGCRLHMPTNCTGYVVCTRGMTNVSISGLSVYGGLHYAPGWTSTNRIIRPNNMSEYGWISVPSGNQTPTNARSGFYLAMFGRGVYNDLTADGFNVAGFYLSNTNTQYDHDKPIASFENPNANYCYVGIELPGGLHVCDFTTNNSYLFFDSSGQIPNWGDPQYTFVNNPVIHNCSIGIMEGSWNVSISNPQISDSFIGVFMPGNSHGEITGGSLNHNSGVSYYMSGVSAGEVVTGQQLRGGDGLYICGGNAGVTFNGCMFDSASILVVTNNIGATIFNGCSWADSFAFTLDNTGIGVVTNGCYSENTITGPQNITWVGNHSGNGNTLTNLNPANLGSGTLPQSTLPTGVLTNNGAANLSTLNATNATFGAVNVATNLNAGAVTTTNLCLAGQFGEITQFLVPGNGSNSVTCPAGQTYFVGWNSARNLNTLIWTNGYGVGVPITITNAAWPVPGTLILKAGWVLSLSDVSGYQANGFYYGL